MEKVSQCYLPFGGRQKKAARRFFTAKNQPGKISWRTIRQSLPCAAPPIFQARLRASAARRQTACHIHGNMPLHQPRLHTSGKQTPKLHHTTHTCAPDAEHRAAAPAKRTTRHQLHKACWTDSRAAGNTHARKPDDQSQSACLRLPQSAAQPPKDSLPSQASRARPCSAGPPQACLLAIADNPHAPRLQPASGLCHDAHPATASKAAPGMFQGCCFRHSFDEGNHILITVDFQLIIINRRYQYINYLTNCCSSS